MRSTNAGKMPFDAVQGKPALQGKGPFRQGRNLSGGVGISDSKTSPVHSSGDEADAGLGTGRSTEACEGYSGGKGSTIENQKQDRRRYPRYKTPKGMLVGWQGGGKRNVSRTETLSMGGVYLCVAEPLAVGGNLELIFDVPTGEVRARAIVRHGRTGRGMGVQFVHMRAEDRARLSRFLQKLEPELLKTKENAAAVASWFVPDELPLDSGEIDGHHALFALLNRVYSGALTGKLQLVSGSVERQLFFDGGQLVFAMSSDRQDSLGEMMLRAGALTQKEFEEAAALVETGQRFGSAIAEMGVCSVEEVFTWVQRQLTQITASVLEHPACRYYFFSSLEKNVVPEIGVPVPLGELLLDAVRKADDLPLERLAEDEELWVELSPDPLLRYQAVKLEEGEQRLIWAISRAEPAKKLVLRCGLPKDRATRALYALMALGIVVSVPQGARAERELAVTIPAPEPAGQPSVESESPEQFEQEVRRLLELAEKATYYELLGVTANSSASDVKQSFHRMARKFHPDRHMGRSEWVGLLQDLMARLTTAYKTLVDQEKRVIYDQRLTASGAFSLGQSKTESQETLDESLMRAKQCLRAHNFAGSILWLRKCVEIAPDVAKYHAILARSLASMPQYRQESIREFEKAIELDAWNTSTYYQFAELYEVMQLRWRAASLYRKILEIDPQHSKARGRLSQLEGKSEDQDEKSFAFVSRLFHRKS